MYIIGMKKERPLHYFTKDYIERASKLTPDDIVQYLEDYGRAFYETPEKCRPISLRVEPSLLRAFKQKAELEGVPYQTQIKKLMREWLL